MGPTDVPVCFNESGVPSPFPRRRLNLSVGSPYCLLPECNTVKTDRYVPARASSSHRAIPVCFLVFLNRYPEQVASSRDESWKLPKTNRRSGQSPRHRQAIAYRSQHMTRWHGEHGARFTTSGDHRAQRNSSPKNQQDRHGGSEQHDQDRERQHGRDVLRILVARSMKLTGVPDVADRSHR
jgi:hypothetical protein